MDALLFIQANFWFLLAICGAVFVFGIALYIVGKLIQGAGERRLNDIYRRQAEAAPLYPPVDDYDPIYESDYR